MMYIIVSVVSGIIGACIGVTVTCLLTASKRMKHSHIKNEERDAPAGDTQ